MYQQLRDYAWNYLTRKERLEEVLQDTFWSIYVNMEIVMKEENYYSWIFECFKNNLKEAIQKEIVSRRTEVSYEAITRTYQMVLILQNKLKIENF